MDMKHTNGGFGVAFQFTCSFDFRPQVKAIAPPPSSHLKQAQGQAVSAKYDVLRVVR